jgi:hydroxymethylpyrimidine kinase/phosphomethylpyrimidine kinase
MTINGADPTGQTGIAADLAVFRTHRLTTQCVVTAAHGPGELFPLPTTVVGGQLSVALRQATPVTVKIGVLGTAEIAGSIGAHVRAGDLRNVVIDPELEAGHGFHQGVVAAIMRLLPMATVLTPNIDEASALVGFPVANTSDMAGAAAQLAARGARYVVITGGRLGGEECVDAVWTPSGTRFMHAPRIDAPNTRGAGCMFSAMIAARLAQGRTVTDAIAIAKEHVTKALSAARAHAHDTGHVSAMSPPAVSTAERTAPIQPTRREVPAHATDHEDETSVGLQAVGDARSRASTAA